MRAKLKLLAGLIALIGFSLGTAGGAASSVPTVNATLVRVTQTSLFSPPSPDPAGVVYIPDSDTLLICDSEVDEMPPYWAGKNVFEVTLSGVLVGAGSTIWFSDEPTGVAYDPVSKKLFISDDNLGWVFIIDPGPDGLFTTEDDIVTYFSTRAIGSHDPEDIRFDSLRGHLLVVDGEGTEVL
jgi:DNA-binding beta-propeller fold protein YncE